MQCVVHALLALQFTWAHFYIPVVLGGHDEMKYDVADDWLMMVFDP